MPSTSSWAWVKRAVLPVELWRFPDRSPRSIPGTDALRPEDRTLPWRARPRRSRVYVPPVTACSRTRVSRSTLATEIQRSSEARGGGAAFTRTCPERLKGPNGRVLARLCGLVCPASRHQRSSRLPPAHPKEAVVPASAQARACVAGETASTLSGRPHQALSQPPRPTSPSETASTPTRTAATRASTAQIPLPS